MLQKNSFTIPSDTSGIYLVRIIQTRRCSSRKHAKSGKFLRVVLRKTKTKLLSRRKSKTRAIVVRSSHTTLRFDGTTYKFSNNAVVLLKRRMNTIARETVGPTVREMKIKKFRKSFISIF